MGSSSGKAAATGATDSAAASVEAEERGCAAGLAAIPRYFEIDSPGSRIGWYPAGGPNCCDLPDSGARNAGVDDRPCHWQAWPAANRMLSLFPRGHRDARRADDGDPANHRVRGPDPEIPQCEQLAVLQSRSGTPRPLRLDRIRLRLNGPLRRYPRKQFQLQPRWIRRLRQVVAADLARRDSLELRRLGPHRAPPVP